MSQEDLFEAIRKEDVVVFAGAGFSCYAGYPLGGCLAKMLVERLTPEQKLKISVGAPLEYLSEEIIWVNFGSRDMVNDVLDEAFGAQPVSTADHDLFASIPHFKTVITTNYDALFENAYNDSVLIFREQDVSRWDDKKVNILKIHGDLSDKSSIILTREDYARFYRKDYSTPFWSLIIKAIATKNILFLGYGYEDPNVWAIFEHVYGNLGDTRKAAYFVSPGATEEKIAFLESKNIHYLKHTGESFLKAVQSNIREHIFEDMRNKWPSPETFRKFTSHHNLTITLQDTGDSYQVQSIAGRNGDPMHGGMKFKIDPGSAFEESYRQFFEHGNTEELIFGETVSNSLRMDVEGIKLFRADELSQISVKKTPKIIPFDLIFSSEGFEIANLNAHIYAGKKSISIKTKIHTLSFQLDLNFANPNDLDSKWSMEHDAIYRNLNEELAVHQFLKYFFSQKTATIYLNKDSKIVKECPSYDETRIKDAEIYIKYFNGLKEVEKAFDVRFTDFYPIDQESVDVLNWVLHVISGGRFDKGESMELSFGELSPETIDNLAKLKDTDAPMELTMNCDLVMILHEQRLPIPGVHTEIASAEVTNLEELRNGGKVLKVRSRTGTIFQKFFLKPFPSIADEQE